MEAKSIISTVLVIIFISALLPLGLDAFSDGRLLAENESEQLDYYNSLSDADKANYTSEYAEDGEPPTPWHGGSLNILTLTALITVILVANGVLDR